MEEQTVNKDNLPMPLVGAAVVGVLSALVVGFSFVVIKYWPQPPSVVPALSFVQGAWWGAIAGGITGFVLGFLTDDKHFVQ